MASPIKLSNELLRIIGSIVVYHAEIEHWLDAIVNTLHMYVPASKVFSRQYPLAFAAEITFLRKCLSELSVLTKYRDEGDAMLDEIEKISEDRSHIVHGFVRRWDPDIKHLEFTRVHRMKGEPAGIILSITEEQLARDLERIDAFRDPVEKFALRILEEFMPPERFKKSLGREG